MPVGATPTRARARTRTPIPSQEDSGERRWVVHVTYEGRVYTRKYKQPPVAHWIKSCMRESILPKLHKNDNVILHTGRAMVLSTTKSWNSR